MGGDSWGAALLEWEVRGVVADHRKQKQKVRQRSKAAERQAAKNLKRRAPTGQRAEKPRKAAGAGVQPAEGVDPWRRKSEGFRPALGSRTVALRAEW